VLALRAFGRFTPEGTPYSGLSTLGRFSDLRGYTSGENVAENLIALQGEYRMMFTKKIGAVAFIGVSQLYNGSIKNTDSDTFYPSGGIGFRYMLNVENKMNFRFDYAWGSDDEEGFYVSVGEAF
jgi:hemolysin activation/secretion protein